MAIQGIGGVAPQRLDTGTRPIEGLAPQDGSFGDVLKDALGEVSKLQDSAQDVVGAFLRGEPVELHQVMAATEEAGIALELLIEIRNKLTEAYRSVINMQG
ncbi:MAG: flagellar hook-basal body complex protein FliE [Gemmatimonadota bacterium]